MNLYTFEHNGRLYKFAVTYGAKIEIENMQKANLLKMSDKDIASALVKLRKKDVDLENMSDEDFLEMIPSLPKVMDFSDDTDEVKIGYILLKNHKDHRGMSYEEFQDLLDAMQEKLGFEETMTVFKEMSNKVFSVLEKLKTSHQKK